MTAATTTRLPIPQWRLLNLIYDQRFGRGRPCLLLPAADASLQDLLALEAGGLVAAERASEKITLADQPDPAKVAAGRNVAVYITRAGMNWVGDNPANHVLAAIHVHSAGSARGARLSAVLRDAPANLDAVNELRGHRLIVAVDADGEQFADRPLGQQAVARGEGVFLKLTQLGRKVRYPTT